jgi:hypothetical protein
MDIQTFIQRLLATESENWFYSIIPAEQTPDKNIPETVIADQHYVQIDLKSLRIVHSRKGFSKFYGVVHSFIKMSHLDGENLEFNVVTTPSLLKELDGDHIDRVIPVNIPLLGQVPYRGSGMQIQLGLFSVKSTDLTSSVINLFSEMSETAGVSFISAALPYTKFLNRGIGVLTGSEKDTILEIGISTTLSQFKTGYYVIMRAPKDQMSIADLYITEHDFKLVGKNGKSIKDFPYLVYKVSALPIRNDWFMIPEIKAAYQQLKGNIKARQLKEAEKSLSMFESVVFSSGDLLFQDAERIFAKVSTETNRIITVQQTAAKKNHLPSSTRSTRHDDRELPELEKLSIF